VKKANMRKELASAVEEVKVFGGPYSQRVSK
jgi:hypothetical protein